MKEDVLQAQCFQWLWNTYPETRRCCWHVPNGGDRRKVQAAQFKAMGVLAGVSDIHFIWQSRLYIIELKVGTNYITDVQEQYIHAATKQGAIFYECRSFEKWQAIMINILSNKPMPCEEYKLLKVGTNAWIVIA